MFQWLRQHRSGLQLKKHGIHQLIVIGLIAHTCIEATVRYAAELGYEVTVVKDATADYSNREMHAALEINIPNYAGAIVTTKEVVGSISSLRIARSTSMASFGSRLATPPRSDRPGGCFVRRGKLFGGPGTRLPNPNRIGN